MLKNQLPESDEYITEEIIDLKRELCINLDNASAFSCPQEATLGFWPFLLPKGLIFDPLVFLLNFQAGEQVLV